MRLLRAISCLLILSLVSFGLISGTGSANAENVGEASRRAQEAENAKRSAEGLLDSAVANRAVIEAELAASISRLNDLAAELSEVSVALDRLSAQKAFAESRLTSISGDIEVHAVNAYMSAIGVPTASFVNSSTVENFMVASQAVNDVVSSNQRSIDQLIAQKRSLEGLVSDFLSRQTKVAALQAEFEEETAKLTSLYEAADAAVADAIKKANKADAAYRSALGSVDSARAREEERKRQERRPTTTTTTPGAATTTTSTAATTSSTTSGGGGWVFPPKVERWRGLVHQYFPTNRVEQALRILQCESLGDPDAYNPYSGASGLFQFLPSTWASTAPKAGFAGASVFEPEANVASAAWLANRYEELGQYYWQAWSCRRVLN